MVANKLWLEFWPDESPVAELEGSLARMGFDYLDLVYCASPPDGLPLADLVAAIDALVTAGKARAWGVLNWSADLLREACSIARDGGFVLPCATQLPYSLSARRYVEDDTVISLLDGFGVRVVASAVLAGGLLSGKYGASGATTGRLAGHIDPSRHGPALRVVEQLETLGEEIGATSAALAIAFAASNPHVASVLFGATSVDQVAQNVDALDVLARMSAAQLAALRAISP